LLWADGVARALTAPGAAQRAHKLNPLVTDKPCNMDTVPTA